MNNWISCEDKFPKIGEPVLVITKDNNFYILSYHWVKQRIMGEMKNLYYSWQSRDIDDFELSLEKVTHWMPLPNPPEKK